MSTEDYSEFLEVIDGVRRVGENLLDGADPNGRQALVGLWLSREAHLALRRAHEMMTDGIPPDTAFFLAVDDMGFQLAHAYMKQISSP